MEFEYCEKCGKRVSQEDIDAGQGVHIGIDYFCSDCAPDENVLEPAATVADASDSNGQYESDDDYDDYEDDYEDDYGCD